VPPPRTPAATPPGFFQRLGGQLSRRAAASCTLDTRSLAAYRIGLGLLLLTDSLLRTRDFTLMFGPEGMLPLAAIADYFGGDSTNWSIACWRDAAWWGGAILAAEGLAGLALVAGWQTRPATIVGWVALVSVVRRTAPTTNAGDLWLGCQLFWSMFLPLGERWSLDARQRMSGGAATGAGPAVAVRSIASAALVLQLAAVYLGAGLAKCNPTWFEGEPVVHALSVHDHGTLLGTLLVQFPWLTRAAQWGVLAGEIALPLVLIAVPRPRVRGGLVALFVGYHLVIWLTMTVGLFAPIGIVAWLPLIPGAFWPTEISAGQPRVARLGRVASWACGLAVGLAAVSFGHAVTPWRGHPLPRLIGAPLNLTGLAQVWEMFALVPPQEQWVYGRAVLADGSVVDILREGRPLERVRPAGGFSTLPHHRWHKFFWVLPWPRARVFAGPAAAALARDWNERSPPTRRIESLEIRYVSQPVRDDHRAIRDTLIAAWPPRSPAGSGNLDRFLRRSDATAWPLRESPSSDASLTLLPPGR
jgi:hypothetical protein